jgi:PEP-CTERM motif
MKITHKLSSAAFSLLILGIASTGMCQTYQLTGTIPSFDLTLDNSGNSSSSTSALNFLIAGGSYSDTVTINSSASTIEEAGSISLQGATGVFDLTNEIVTTITQFPNPPTLVTQAVTGVLTASLSYNSGMTFDTGVQSLNWNGKEYTFNGNAGINGPITLSYSLVTGGDTYTGAAEFGMFSFDGGSAVDASEYPASISLDPSPQLVLGEQPYKLVNITAADGFQEVIGVPEPATPILLGLGVVAFSLLRRPVMQQR